MGWMMESILYLGIIMLIAGFIQGFSGFGSVLLSLPLLVIFLDVKTAIPLVALMGVILTVFLLIPLWKDLEWPRIWPLLVGALPGVPIGIFFLKSLNSRLLLIFLGFILVCYSLYSLLFKVAGRELNIRWAYFSGFLAGCFGGAFSAAGPPVIVYVSIQSWRKELIKSTLQGFFLISPQVLELFFYSLAPLALGTYTGHFFFGKIREETYRRVILILLLCLGVFTLWNAR
jgi:uncharacterized membrane protein YfcA